LDLPAGKKWTNDTFFNKKFPFNDANPLENYDLSSINAYVQNVISQATTGEVKLSTEVFETHRSVIAKIKLPKQLHPKNLRIQVNANNIKIEKTEGNEEQIIHLPCRVDPSGRKAVYKQSVLEIRIPKVNTKDPYHEVFIRY
jgi:HSP20 family protein